LKNEVGVEVRKKSEVILKPSNVDAEKILKANENYIAELAAAEPITFSDEKPQHALAGVVEGVEIFLPLKGLIDTEKEIARLTKELEKLRKGIAMTEGKLKNEKFLSKAPAEVVQAEREKLSAAQEKISSVESRISQLKNL
ncbi:MAG: valine--tRNA ligase, partial [Selenomonadaceae bacterium]|nr:valine--tRNA ligase [Selenomonadaceae bacterium]